MLVGFNQKTVRKSAVFFFSHDHTIFHGNFLTMKRNAVLLLILLPLFVNAQQTAPYTRLLVGNTKSFKQLKGQKSYNLIFDYDSMLVGRDVPEVEFLNKKKETWEAKETGKGAEFEQMWFADRKRRYEPTFIRNFEKFAKVKVGDSAAKYTLILKTTRTEGGWNAGVVQSPAMLDLELAVVETADRNKVIVKIGFPAVKGRKYQGGDFEMTERILDAYMYASKALGEFMKQRT
jgi:hypothetical protein